MQVGMCRVSRQKRRVRRRRRTALLVCALMLTGGIAAFAANRLARTLGPTPEQTLNQAHLAALEYLEKGGHSDVFNLGNGTGYSVNEIIETARRVTGREIKAVVEPNRPGDPSVLIASNHKAREVLRWQPTRGLEQIISDAWIWHSGHPHGYEE